MPSSAFLKANREGKKFELFVMDAFNRRGLKSWKNPARKYKDRVGWDFEFLFDNRLWKVECKLDIMSTETGNFCFDLKTLANTISHYWVHGFPTATGYQAYMQKTSTVRAYCAKNGSRNGGEFNDPICIVSKEKVLAESNFTRIA